MAGALADAPGLNEVTIGSKTFLVNTSFEPYRRDCFRHRSIASQRDSVNIAGKTGEGTINTEGLWRSTGNDWSFGAGQLYADRDTSVATRFFDSKGVDVFTTQFQASLLPDTKQVYADTGSQPTTNQVLTVGAFIFYYSNVDYSVYYSSDTVTWTKLLTGTSPGGLRPLATDGNNLFICDGSSLKVAVVGASSVGSVTTILSDTIDCVFAAGGRVLCGAGPSLYDVTPILNQTSAPLPSALMVHPNPQWHWHDACAGSSNIYLTGFGIVGGNVEKNTSSAVYRTTMESDGTALTAPVIALPLGANEYGWTLFSYLNYVFLGTNLGIRMCRTVSASDPEGNTGDLIAGPLLPNLLHPISGNVSGICGNNRFIYFVWEGYDNEDGGLGVLDLSRMLGELQPAYASHLMCRNTGGTQIVSCAWDPVHNYPCMGLQGAKGGVWTIDASNLVPQGWIDSGRVTYNIPDDKIPCQGLIRRDAGTFITTTSALPTTAITSIPCQALKAQVNANDLICVSDGWNMDVFTASANAALGATSIPVNSQAPSSPYASGSTIQDVTTPAATLAATPGTVSMFLQADGNGYQPVTPLSPNTQQSPPVLMSNVLTNPIRGEELNVRVVLTRDATNTNTGPTLHRWMLKSLPAVASGTTVSPVLQLYTNNEDAQGRARPSDPYSDYAYLEGLRLTQTPVSYKEGTEYTAVVVIDEIDWLPYKERDTGDYGYEGDCIVYLRTIVG